MKKKILAFIVLVFAGVLIYNNTANASEEETTTVPPSTIGSINGPADVDDPTETTVFENHCYDVGNGDGTGQDDFFQDCELPTTTVVEVGEPPIPGCGDCETNLPATGIDAATIAIFAWCLVVLGVILMLIRFSKKNSNG